jgi:hypothetical protein
VEIDFEVFGRDPTFERSCAVAPLSSVVKHAAESSG